MSQVIALVKSGIGVRPALDELSMYPSLWRENTIRQDTLGSPHAHTETIFLRFTNNTSLESIFSDLDAVDFPAFSKLPLIRPIVADLLKVINSKKLGRVMLVNLRAGGYIPKHIDEGAYADHYERFHVVLSSEEGNEFYVEQSDSPEIGTLAKMKVGEAYWFNHKKPHWVFNGSTKGRIHLIVDAVAPSFRKEREQ